MLTYGCGFCGLPGSGKTTLTQSVREICANIGRPTKIINLDPAGNSPECDFDIQNYVQVDDVMEQMKCGPNGSLLISLKYFIENNGLAELQNFILQNKNNYFLFDLPGQVECYVADDNLRMLF